MVFKNVSFIDLENKQVKMTLKQTQKFILIMITIHACFIHQAVLSYVYITFVENMPLINVIT